MKEIDKKDVNWQNIWQILLEISPVTKLQIIDDLIKNRGIPTPEVNRFMNALLYSRKIKDLETTKEEIKINSNFKIIVKLHGVNEDILRLATSSQTISETDWIRELIQNSRDSIKIGNNRQGTIEIQIEIGSNGRNVLQIDDTGIGMTPDTVLNKFLRPLVPDQFKKNSQDAAGGLGWGFWSAVPRSTSIHVVTVGQVDGRKMQTSFILNVPRDDSGNISTLKLMFLTMKQKKCQTVPQ